jgi:hypothetical protein
MRRISSKLTYVYKRVFPAVWFGFLGLFAAIVLLASSSAGRWPPLPFLLVPAAIGLFGYFVMDKLVFDLVDEVLDDKEALIIKNGRRQERVDVRDIVNVGFMQFANPPRVTLSLKKPGAFGSQVSFCAPARFLLLSQSPIVAELSKRIDSGPTA